MNTFCHKRVLFTKNFRVIKSFLKKRHQPNLIFGVTFIVFVAYSFLNVLNIECINNQIFFKYESFKSPWRVTLKLTLVE